MLLHAVTVLAAAAVTALTIRPATAAPVEYEKVQTNNPAQQANRLRLGHPTIYLQGTLTGIVAGAYQVTLMGGAQVTDGRYNLYVQDDGSAPSSSGTMTVTQNHVEQDATPVGAQVWVYGYGILGGAPVGSELVDLHATAVSPEQQVTVNIDSCLWVLA